MKDNDTVEFEEDLELKATVKEAFDVGEVPERLRKSLHADAERIWFENRKQQRSRMHKWLSGLTSVAAAAIICMHSATQYFGGIEHQEQLRNLDHIMDLVATTDIDDTVTDEELAAFSFSQSNETSIDTLAARIDRLQSFDDFDEE